jgi:hypothetical protein
MTVIVHPKGECTALKLTPQHIRCYRLLYWERASGRYGGNVHTHIHFTYMLYVVCFNIHCVIGFYNRTEHLVAIVEYHNKI